MPNHLQSHLSQFLRAPEPVYFVRIAGQRAVGRGRTHPSVKHNEYLQKIDARRSFGQ